MDEDRSESTDLAADHPEKLAHLIQVWFDEADKNNVLPLDDRTPVELLAVDRPRSEPPRTRYVYYPDTSPVPEGVAVSIRGRDYKILADVVLTDDSEGVLLAQDHASAATPCSSRITSCITCTTSSARTSRS